jgi:acetyltransferase-like isoleucine patch superfamily enzyme
MKLFTLIYKIYMRIKDFLLVKILKIYFKKIGAKIDKSVIFYGKPILDISSGGHICIGGNSVLVSRAKNTALGVNHPCILRLLSPGARIEISSDVGMSGTTICAMKAVYVGKECLFGANVIISDTDFHPLNPEGRRYSKNGIDSKEVVIEDNVFIGTGAIILKGVQIGKNSVIGAGAVVTKNIPSNCIAAGNPATVIREL